MRRRLRLVLARAAKLVVPRVSVAVALVAAMGGQDARANEPTKRPRASWQERCLARFDEAKLGIAKTVTSLGAARTTLNDAGLTLSFLDMDARPARALQVFIALEPPAAGKERAWSFDSPEGAGSWADPSHFGYVDGEGQARRYPEDGEGTVANMRVARSGKLFAFIALSNLATKDAAAVLPAVRQTVDDCLGTLP